MTRRAHALLLAALAACPGRDTTTTDATASSSGAASSTGTSGPGTSGSGAPTTGAADTTGATSGATSGSTGGTSGSTGGTTGAANPCDMCVGTLCVQHYDGFCNSSDVTCMANPDGCVPPAPGEETCSPACEEFCSPFCGTMEMCGDEVPGALHCYGL